MSILVDTNILLRRTQPAHPDHAVAVESVAPLLAGELPDLIARREYPLRGDAVPYHALGKR